MALKVLHVIDHLAFGGGQTSVRAIVENVTGNEFEYLLCQLRAVPESISLNANLITLHYGKYDPRAFFALARLCREHKINILHAHLQKSIIICLLISCFYNIPVIVHEHGPINWKGIFSIYRWALRILHHKAAAIIANSRFTANELVKRAAVKKGRIEVIYNPVDFDVFDCRRFSKEHCRRNLDISNEDFVVGYVGRLHHVKGVDILVRAFASLLKRSAQYLLVMAGDGPQRKYLETLTKQMGIAARVRFLGMRPNVPEIMATFDVAVVPSRQEPSGIVPIELMRMKIPVVSSGKEGLAESVENRVTGLVARENNPDEIYLCIRTLAEDDGLRNKLVETAYAFSEQFNPAEQIRKIERLYKQAHELKKTENEASRSRKNAES